MNSVFKKDEAMFKKVVGDVVKSFKEGVIGLTLQGSEIQNGVFLENAETMIHHKHPDFRVVMKTHPVGDPKYTPGVVIVKKDNNKMQLNVLFLTTKKANYYEITDILSKLHSFSYQEKEPK